MQKFGMVSTRPFISKSSSAFTNPSVTAPRAPITIGINVTFMFPSFFFNSLAGSRYLFFFSFSFNFTLWSTGTFLLIIIRSGLLAEIRWSVWISESHMNLCVSFSRTGVGLCIYYLFVWSNLNFLHNSQWITFPTQSCQVLYSFRANLLHSLIMWLMVSYLLPTYNLHLLFCCVLFILALIWLVLMALCCIVAHTTLLPV